MARWRDYDPRRLPQGPLEYQKGIVAEMSERLQLIWKANNEQTARWRLSGFESWMYEVMAGSSAAQPLPPGAPLAQAFAYLRRKCGKLRRCANAECHRPFFIAAKGERRYCSKRCAETKPRHSKIKEPLPTNKDVQSQIPESAVKVFIHDLANADDEKIDDGKLYSFTHYPAFFPTKDQDIAAVASLAAHNPAMLAKMKDEWPQIYHRSLIRDLRDGLRNIWQSEDVSKAEWQMFRLQSLMHRHLDLCVAPESKLQPPPAHAPIHQALNWVRENFSNLRKCKNADCRLPLFVAVGKQRFCSTACADVEQRMHKKRWWEKHGEEWRRNRAEGKRCGKTPVAKRKQR